MRPRMLRLLLLPIALIFSSEALSDTVLCKYRNNIVHGPFKNQLNNDSEIYFSESKDSNEPIYLITSKMKSGKCEKETIIERYYIAGSPPSVETLFFHNIHNKKMPLQLFHGKLTVAGLGHMESSIRFLPIKRPNPDLSQTKK